MSVFVDGASWRQLTNALTALGYYLAAAKDEVLRSGSDSKLAQVLDNTVAQHERAVQAVRQLRDELPRSLS